MRLAGDAQACRSLVPVRTVHTTTSAEMYSSSVDVSSPVIWSPKIGGLKGLLIPCPVDVIKEPVSCHLFGSPSSWKGLHHRSFCGLRLATEYPSLKTISWKRGLPFLCFIFASRGTFSGSPSDDFSWVILVKILSHEHLHLFASKNGRCLLKASPSSSVDWIL